MSDDVVPGMVYVASCYDADYSYGFIGQRWACAFSVRKRADDFMDKQKLAFINRTLKTRTLRNFSRDKQMTRYWNKKKGEWSQRKIRGNIDYVLEQCSDARELEMCWQVTVLVVDPETTTLPDEGESSSEASSSDESEDP
jgi:hypothetical protein